MEDLEVLIKKDPLRVFDDINEKVWKEKNLAIEQLISRTRTKILSNDNKEAQYKTVVDYIVYLKLLMDGTVLEFSNKFYQKLGNIF